MGVFFDGREIISPATASKVDDSALANHNLDVGNILALIGRSSGGQPNTALRFGSPDEAITALGDGPLVDAIKKAFDPSAETGAPSTIVGVRVNPATQSTLTMVDGTSANAIVLTSTDYGLKTNQIKVKVESGSSVGKKLTSQVGINYYSEDNIHRNALTMQYTGAQASATLTIVGDTVTLAAPSGNTVASIDLNAYPTVQQLVDRINATTGFGASVTDGNAEKPTLNGLDYVTAVDVKSAPYVVKADLQACIDWFDSTGEGFVDAARATSAGAPPANIPFTYLAGGSDGSVTNTEWQNAYTTLQQEDVQWVVPLSSDPAIHAMNDAHCAFMSTVGRMERRGLQGTALGTSDASAITAALALNSDRSSLLHIGYYDYDANSVLTLYPPYMTAALVAAMFAGANPGTPMTNKSMKVRGLERYLRNPTDTDVLLKGGVLPVEKTKKGYKVVQSITTWLVNDNFNRREVGVGTAIDHVARELRDATDTLRGQKGTPTLLSTARENVASKLDELAKPEPQGPGIITGDATNPAWKNLKVSLVGDVIAIQVEVHPVIGVNYVLISIFATPFSGSVTA